MKVGDKVPVTVAGLVVAQAEVTEIGDGTATLVIPGTKAIFGTHTELTDTPEQDKETGTVIIGTEAASGKEEPVEPPVEPGGSEVVDEPSEDN